MGFASMDISEFQEERVKELSSSKTWMKDRTMKLITNLDDFKSFINKAIEKGLCALDLETTGLSTRIKKTFTRYQKVIYEPVNKIVGFCLSYDSKCGIYVPISHQEEPESNLPEKEVLEDIKRLCKNCKTIYHNAKFDLQMLRNYGITIESYDEFEDTLLLARLYDAGQKEINLKVLSDRLLNQPMLKLEELSKEGRFHLVAPRIGYRYGASDAICTLDLYKFFMDQKVIKDQISIYNLEKRTSLVVLFMERNLVKIDIDYLEKLKTNIVNRMHEIEQEIYKIAGREFNIASTPQLGHLLFEELNYTYPDRKKTASGQYKTDTTTLEKIKDTYPIVENILEYRVLEKSLGTYVNNLLTNADDEGCIKLGFNQSGTDTGRFSSPGGKGLKHDGYCGVNVQSIPAKYDEKIPDIRRAFIARPGNKIVAMDYAAEELRIAANLSGEIKWIEALENDADLHTATGQIIFGRKEITKDERKISKKINFLSLYGGGSKTFAIQAKISEREAKRIMKQFFSGLSGLKKWIDKEKARARHLGYAQTTFGRIRPLQMFYNSGREESIAHADRCAVNFLVQGAAADIIKTAMVRVYNWIKSQNLLDEIKILITVHDEIVFEMPEEKMGLYIPKLNNIMKLEDILQEHVKWRIPLKIDAEYGDSWHIESDFFKENPKLEKSNPIIFQKTSQITEAIKSDNSEINSNKENISENKPEIKSEIREDNIKSLNEAPVIKIEEKNHEEKEIQPLITNETLIYTIRDRRKSTLRRLNNILCFLAEEKGKKINYNSPVKILQIRDPEGNSLLIDRYVQSDAFLALARMEGL